MKHRLSDYKGVLCHIASTEGFLGVPLSRIMAQEWPSLAGEYSRWARGGRRLGSCFLHRVSDSLYVASLCACKGGTFDEESFEDALSDLASRTGDQQVVYFVNLHDIAQFRRSWDHFRITIRKHFPNCSFVTA